MMDEPHDGLVTSSVACDVQQRRVTLHPFALSSPDRFVLGQAGAGQATLVGAGLIDVVQVGATSGVHACLQTMQVGQWEIGAGAHAHTRVSLEMLVENDAGVGKRLPLVGLAWIFVLGAVQVSRLSFVVRRFASIAGVPLGRAAGAKLEVTLWKLCGTAEEAHAAKAQLRLVAARSVRLQTARCFSARRERSTADVRTRRIAATLARAVAAQCPARNEHQQNRRTGEQPVIPHAAFGLSNVKTSSKEKNSVGKRIQRFDRSSPPSEWCLRRASLANRVWLVGQLHAAQPHGHLVWSHHDKACMLSVIESRDNRRGFPRSVVGPDNVNLKNTHLIMIRKAIYGRRQLCIQQLQLSVLANNSSSPVTRLGIFERRFARPSSLTKSRGLEYAHNCFENVLSKNREV